MKTNIVSLRILILIFSLFNITQATVLYVHPDSIQNCIQDCLNACTTGDTVLVGPGTYYENIVWPATQGIVLVSEYGSEMTIVDGDSAGSVILCTTGVDTTTVITGFTITKGYAEAGGGILCYRSSPTISNCAILNNSIIPGANDRYGGGIYCRKSSPIIRDNIIANNRAVCWNPVNTIRKLNRRGYGGGIACLDSSVPVVYRNIIDHNRADCGGGGIFCDGYSAARIVSNTIEFNGVFANGSGGGIHCSMSDCVIDSNLIRENELIGVGAGVGIVDCSPIITNNLITLNVGRYFENGSSGAGMAIIRSTACVSRNTITQNQLLEEGTGAGIYCDNASPTIDSCNITDNIGDGGVFCTSGATPIIHFNNIVGNDYYGVKNVDSTVMVDAKYNWWGDSTGPYHPIFNPGGLGDTVSDYVDFEPWLLIPVGLLEQNCPVIKHTFVQPTIVRSVINLQSTINHSKSEIFLFDITGRKVADLKAGANNIRHLAPGVYFIWRNINNRVLKIIVTK